MQRAERKLQLSLNVVGEDDMDWEGKQMASPEVGDLRSVIFGLHIFDRIEINNEISGELNMPELIAMAEKVIAMRYEHKTDKDDRKFEITPVDRLSEHDLVMERSSSVSFDPGLDEASYRSWVENFSKASETIDSSKLDLGNKRSLPEENHLKLEAARKKAEEKKVSKWESLGYHSLSVKDPIPPVDDDRLLDLGSVNFVYGDCTHPSKVFPSVPTIIFR